MDMDTMMYPLRLFINVYIAFLNALLFYAILSPKAKLHKLVVWGGTFGICFSALLISLLLYHQYALKLGVVICYLAVLSGLVYQTPFSGRILAASFFVILLMISESVVAALVVVFYGFSAPLYAGDSSVIIQVSPLYLVSYAVCFGLPALVVWQRPRGSASIGFAQFLLLPLSQVVMLGALLYAMYMGERRFVPSDAVVTLLAVVLCIATDVMFLRIIDALVKKKRLEEQQELQKKHYAILMEQEKAMRKLRHDIANHLMTMGLLVGQDDVRAKAYLDELSTRFQESKIVRFCDNQIADIVLCSKSAEAAVRKIRFTVTAKVSENISMNDLDFMSLLSNLLDNALEAAAQSEERFVDVFLREQAGVLALKIKNSISSGTNPDLSRTTKKNLKEHGLGVEIVKGICRQYEGEFLTSREERVFETGVLLILPPVVNQ
ncbi:sensor histidine kinase [Blautia hydrogenotrophica]|uniref:sensor histidine kinase n=1 Tax=Blautia hydrogenotrophica TaxID=53443 RepID=UPI003A864B5F